MGPVDTSVCSTLFHTTNSHPHTLHILTPHHYLCPSIWVQWTPLSVPPYSTLQTHTLTHYTSSHLTIICAHQYGSSGHLCLFHLIPHYKLTPSHITHPHTSPLFVPINMGPVDTSVCSTLFHTTNSHPHTLHILTPHHYLCPSIWVQWTPLSVPPYSTLQTHTLTHYTSSHLTIICAHQYGSSGHLCLFHLIPHYKLTPSHITHPHTSPLFVPINMGPVDTSVCSTLFHTTNSHPHTLHILTPHHYLCPSIWVQWTPLSVPPYSTLQTHTLTHYTSSHLTIICAYQYGSSGHLCLFHLIPHYKLTPSHITHPHTSPLFVPINMGPVDTSVCSTLFHTTNSHPHTLHILTPHHYLCLSIWVQWTPLSVPPYSILQTHTLTHYTSSHLTIICAHQYGSSGHLCLFHLIPHYKLTPSHITHPHTSPLFVPINMGPVDTSVCSTLFHAIDSIQ